MYEVRCTMYNIPMLYAIISDIHSNLEALETVLTDIDRRRVEKIISPGDIIGYGANPSLCLALASERCQVIVKGNHEEAILSAKERSKFNTWAREAILWTMDHLDQKEKDVIESWPYITTDQEADLTLVHGSPDHIRQFRYLFESGDIDNAFSAFQTGVCFVGHTHVPMLFTESGREKQLKAGSYPLDAKERYIINPGSVGQPRDGDRRASYALFDTEKRVLEIVRLDYDNQTAARKIKTAGLPEYLGNRLL
ncbi:MAG: hypothetical protein COV74_05805 [Candidatus Omnitrophica bacterium CG11_big_fil_rev_8_21_14_0_20_45_26]|uniref:Calcineurin-like phosphoesterase domain-containing protein n=1 Tax=Candidatus Abzuiibacterium crystallinum TaxID=1974748 RepID=A0A2H0LP37_9BACT|nr:MAG: hypothetical protein COV74_05805 [Candidatus Omnitrophica bacterium CG11_big_fil_rev_8_21_14_0_20_45_26]PIW64083.1 MAG: metallophosphoesterase [Candidatus Omnitrophica bacterium CG12_big_fil_rev_8_21_14_0_65_45_16]